MTTHTNRFISRIDSNKTFGWFVRAYYSGLEISCFFADKKYGGRARALARAKSLEGRWAETTDFFRDGHGCPYTWRNDMLEIKGAHK